MAEYVRKQVNSDSVGSGAIPKPEQIERVARGGDFWHRVPERGVEDPRDPNSMLKGLAAGLEKFEPRLNKYLGDYHKQYTEDEMAKGEAERRENRAEFAKAVKENRIPRIANPWFMKGYFKQDGQITANDFDAKLEMEYAKSPVRNSNDTMEIQKFTEEFRSNYLKENGKNKNRDWSDGFEPGMKRAEDRLYRKHLATRATAIEADVLNNISIQATQLIQGAKAVETDPFNEEAMTTGRDNLAASLSLIATEAYKNGNDPVEVHKKIYEAIGVQMRVTEDETLQDLRIATGPGSFLHNVPAAKKHFLEVSRQVSNDIDHRMRRQQNMEDRPAAVEARDYQRDQNRRNKDKQVKTDTIEEIAKEMNRKIWAGEGLDEGLLGKMNDISAQDARAMKGYYDDQLKVRGTIATDHDHVANIQHLILTDPHNPEGQRLISSLVKDRKGDSNVAAKLQDEHDRALLEGGKLRTNPAYQSYKRGLAAIQKDPTDLYGEAQKWMRDAEVDFYRASLLIDKDTKLDDRGKDDAMKKKQEELLVKYSKRGETKLKPGIEAGPPGERVKPTPTKETDTLEQNKKDFNSGWNWGGGAIKGQAAASDAESKQKVLDSGKNSPDTAAAVKNLNAQTAKQKQATEFLRVEQTKIPKEVKIAHDKYKQANNHEMLRQLYREFPALLAN